MRVIRVCHACHTRGPFKLWVICTVPQIHLSNEQLQCLLQIVTSKNSFACIGLGPNTVNDKLAGNLDAGLSNSKLEQLLINVTGPAKTGHICTNYTCSEKVSFLGHCV